MLKKLVMVVMVMVTPSGRCSTEALSGCGTWDEHQCNHHQQIIIIITIIISPSSDLSSRVELAAEGSLCGSIVLQLLGVRLGRQHLSNIIRFVITIDHRCHDYSSSWWNISTAIVHRPSGDLSGGPVILESLASALDVASVELNLKHIGDHLYIISPALYRNLILIVITNKFAPRCQGLHRRQTGASPSRGWSWGSTTASTSPGRPPPPLVRTAPTPPRVKL